MAMAQNTTQKYLRYCSEKDFFLLHLNIMIFFQEKMWVTELISLVSAILKSH